MTSTAFIRFIPFYGILDEQYLCYLLDIDDFYILLDCGWDTTFNINILKPLELYIKNGGKIDAILISHPDILHLGGLPYLIGKLGVTAKIYATVPVYKMGLMFLYDAYQSIINNESFDIFNLDDIDTAFDNFYQLKYSQHIQLQGGLEISAYPAGHLIGGTIWKIKKETEEIIYAVDYNHKKERHLNGAQWDKVGRPSLMITDSFCILKPQTSRKARDHELLETVINTLNKNGNVLLPVDTSGRVLELLITINQYWTQNKLSNYSVFLSHVGYNTIEFAKSQLEWMNDSIMNTFEHSRENPFALKYIRLCYNLEELKSISEPIVVLASMPDLESGFARELFIEWCEEPNNLIIFTDRGMEGTLSRQLINLIGKIPVTLTIEIKKKVFLEGKELDEYENKKKEELEKKKQEKNNFITDIDEDEEGEEDIVLTKMPFQNHYDMTFEQFLQEGFKYPIFPYIEKTHLFDEYGEIVTLNDFEVNDDNYFFKKINEKDKNLEESNMEIDQFNINEKPFKYIKYMKTIIIKCGIKYIDFEGRSDGRSMKTIIQQIQPRKLILIHGSDESKLNLQQFCEKNLKSICKMIISPKANEIVNVSSDANIYKVKLKDTLMDTLEFKEIGNYSLSYIDGIISKPIEENEEKTNQSLPILDINTNNDKGHKVVFIGEVKLSDFKHILINHGYKSDLYAGVLVTCDGSIVLRKKEIDGHSEIQIEGILSTDYFKIRDLLYSQYTIL